MTKFASAMVCLAFPIQLLHPLAGLLILTNYRPLGRDSVAGLVSLKLIYGGEQSRIQTQFVESKRVSQHCGARFFDQWRDPGGAIWSKVFRGEGVLRETYLLLLGLLMRCLTEYQPRVPMFGLALKRFLLILSDRIFDSSVDRAIPSFAAAPDSPDTRPWHSRRVASMISFS
jgi:hypothetical protein